MSVGMDPISYPGSTPYRCKILDHVRMLQAVVRRRPMVMTVRVAYAKLSYRVLTWVYNIVSGWLKS